jgi:hypothetical protein
MSVVEQAEHDVGMSTAGDKRSIAHRLVISGASAEAAAATDPSKVCSKTHRYLLHRGQLFGNVIVHQRTHESEKKGGYMVCSSGLRNGHAECIRA